MTDFKLSTNNPASQQSAGGISLAVGALSFALSVGGYVPQESKAYFGTQPVQTSQQYALGSRQQADPADNIQLRLGSNVLSFDLVEGGYTPAASTAYFGTQPLANVAQTYALEAQGAPESSDQIALALGDQIRLFWDLEEGGYTARSGRIYWGGQPAEGLQSTHTLRGEYDPGATIQLGNPYKLDFDLNVTGYTPYSGRGYFGTTPGEVTVQHTLRSGYAADETIRLGDYYKLDFSLLQGGYTPGSTTAYFGILPVGGVTSHVLESRYEPNAIIRLGDTKVLFFDLNVGGYTPDSGTAYFGVTPAGGGTQHTLEGEYTPDPTIYLGDTYKLDFYLEEGGYTAQFDKAYVGSLPLDVQTYHTLESGYVPPQTVGLGDAYQLHFYLEEGGYAQQRTPDTGEAWFGQEPNYIALNFDLEEGGYYPRAFDATFPWAGTEPTPPPPYEPPPEINGTFRVRWNQGDPVDRSVGFRWGLSATKDHLVAFPSTESQDPADAEVGFAWDRSVIIDEDTSFKWEETSAKVEARIDLAWGTGTATDRSVLLKWAETGKHLDKFFDFPWGKGNPKDRGMTYAWDGSVTSRDVSVTSGWNKGVPQDLDFRFAWGEGNARDRSVTWPYIVEDPENAPKPYPEVLPSQESYVINNSISVIRLSDSLDITADVLAVNISLDRDSFAWQFSIAVLTETAFAAIAPVNGEVDIKVTINGEEFLLLVEKYSRDRVLGQEAWNLSGRSHHIKLASPYKPKQSYANPSLINAAQAATEELVGTGFTILWDEVDWNFAAGQWTYQNLSPIEAIGALANAPGARVHPIHNSAAIQVVSRMPVKPSLWATTNPDVVITEDAITRLSQEFERGISYDKVFVSGGQNGNIWPVVKQGTGGTNVIDQPIVDSRITDSGPAGQRGLVELYSTGNLISHNIELPVMAPMGLVLPGYLVEVQESSLYRSLCSNVQLFAARNNGALVVGQRITVERYGV